MTPRIRELLLDVKQYLAMGSCDHVGTATSHELFIRIDAELAESEPDHIADAGKMVAPRRLAPGETPTVEGYYWATSKPTMSCEPIWFGEDDYGKWHVQVFGDEQSWDVSDFTDFYGPLTDQREGAT